MAEKAKHLLHPSTLQENVILECAVGETYLRFKNVIFVMNYKKM